jgi:hypothetical protein
VRTRLPARGAWDSSLPRCLSTRRWAGPPGFDRGDDLVGRVFLDVVRGSGEDVGPVVGEGVFPPQLVALLEAWVFVAPDDEGRLVGDPPQSLLDLGEQRVRGAVAAQRVVDLAGGQQ